MIRYDYVATKIAQRSNGCELTKIAFRDFPEVALFGRDPEELERRGAALVEKLICARIAAGQHVPQPGRSYGDRSVEIAPDVTLKLLLHWEREAGDDDAEALAGEIVAGPGRLAQISAAGASSFDGNMTRLAATFALSGLGQPQPVSVLVR